MSKPSRCWPLIVLCMVLLGSLFRFEAAHASESYSFGVVPQYDQRRLYATWKPLLDYLQKRTGLSFRLAAVSRIPEFEKKFLAGDYDFAYMNPYHLLMANKAQGYAPIIRDRAVLRGILVVRRDSPIKTVSELNGKIVAFPAPNAFGASLLMRADLSRLYHINVSPLYVGTHDSVYLHVAKGLADAGGGVEKTLEEQGKSLRDALRILYTTREIPSHPVVVHPGVPKADAKKVSRAFLEMAATKEGRKLLSRIPLEHPVSTSLDDYAALRDWGLESFVVKE